MKIAVIGTGNVAQALVNGLISEGYDVKVGSRSLEKDSENITKLKKAHSNVSITSYTEAVEFGDVIVLPVPGSALVDVIQEIGVQKFEGKILWDITNALSAEAPGNGVIKLITTPEESLAEKIQKLLPSTHVIKAMNTVGAHLMYRPVLSEKGTVFLAGNDEQAKDKISSIVEKFGWESYDTGKIESSRALEYMGQLYVAQGILYNGWNSTFKYVK
ncbi:NAD(P)-binding domain-containing protein [Dysgonomonas sp. HDW5A]|uniref:NADPH-dependent F420 reductase n=1 Tax=Dysgonomonas sp. HDW5A TaxID=2714926 RepID=UPI00140777F0|nr:NAD(P)-binding domain-containing protein [Dysgonomonas sp. HDW5A]QIK60939.1 NAD(P)-binding domain-containing protein [Dysgonomonas sp. HDW5A]